ncbi:hypothetical protein [Tsuneonella sp. SYSU-LHT278]|uniref:hypothetical protein n=1 Tax=Tsuneonella sediminis TaxID=3416089 RepID=UPI003F790442
MKKIVTTALLACLVSGPALAGEITGNDKPITVKGKSSCAFSGQNDTPEGDEGPPPDPGGRVQSYGFFFAQTWLAPFLDPAVNDPRVESFIPGWACNPQRAEPFVGN